MNFSRSITSLKHAWPRFPSTSCTAFQKTRRLRFGLRQRNSPYVFCANTWRLRRCSGAIVQSRHPVRTNTDFTFYQYGAIRGSERLRKNLAQLYSTKKPMSADNLLITPGAIAANMTAFYGLIGKGDHVICHYPTYQQLFEVPISLGAEVDFWRAREEKKWQLDIEELKALIRPNTKMIIINNPHNPTGAIIPKSTLDALIEVAGEHDLILHSDEVYRPIFHVSYIFRVTITTLAPF